MVTIDGVEYTEDQLTEEQKYMVAQLQDLEQKLSQLRFQMDQLGVTKNAFTNALIGGLQNANGDAEEGAEE